MFNYEVMKDAMADLEEEKLLSLLDEVMADGGANAQKAMEACLEGMSEVGQRFEAGEYFVGDLIFAGEILTEGMEKIKPALAKGGDEKIGRVLLCTVKDDLHDIGKNIVKAMLEAGGLDVLDLGIDTPISKIVDTAKEENIHIIALSGVLTLALDSMKDTVAGFVDAGMREKVKKCADELNQRGMRVLGLAQKTNPAPVGAFLAEDEKDMVLIGYLAFLDLPKTTTADAIEALHRCGVDVKVLTGDNEKVTRCICEMVGIPAGQILLGEEIETLDDGELADRAENISVFAKLSPEQKARVVEALRANGHCVGYLGDGINDSAAMKASDVGISVDNAVDIAKECAQVILLEKDLLVLEQGVLEGRKVYANMMKYIKLTAASNFGNMFSVLAASVFLPFLPMEAVQILLLNLVYDISCAAIPWDGVDEEFLQKPCRWDAESVGKFMFRIGPVSSVFDILTFLVMYFVICPAVYGGGYHTLDAVSQAGFAALFQTGWFVESMWSQTLVIHLIRTRRIPFIQSRASAPVMWSTFLAIGALTVLPFLPLRAGFELTVLPAVYFPWLALIVAGYMAAMTLVKTRYIRKYGELL